MHDLLATAVAAAEAGAAVLGRWFRQTDLEVRLKAENDFVTRADRDSEAAVVAAIRARHPDHSILAEERGREAGAAAGVEWIIDPLDGTTNFVRGLAVFCVCVACRVNGRLAAAAIADPARGDRFTAERGAGARWNGRPMRVSARPGLAGAFLATGFPFRAKAALGTYLELYAAALKSAQGIRRCGAAGLDLAHTAAGVYDGFFEFHLGPWDIAAGALMIEEAGGRVSDLDGGGRYLESGNVLAGGPALHAALLALAARHASEERLARLLGSR